MSSLKRFLHLEGQRKGRAPSEPPRKDGPSRFSALETERAPRPPGAPDAAPSPAGTMQRFERQVSDQPLATAERIPEEQPFTRCMKCHADNGRYARECINCSEPLHTPEQREFNRALWKERLQQRAEEAKVSEARSAEERDRMAEALFQSELQRHQLEREFGSGSGDVAPGVWLLRKIQDPRRRIIVITASLLTFLIGFVILARAAMQDNVGALVALMMGCILAVALFTPPRLWLQRRRRWWERDDDGFF